ncbi:MAG: hypothetical protein ACI9DJ_000030 [Algoriphagus sp.]|jgi:hypothetical protein
MHALRVEKLLRREKRIEKKLIDKVKIKMK